MCACGKAYGSEGSLNQHKKNKGHYTSADQANLSEAANGMSMPQNQSSTGVEMLMGPGMMGGSLYDDNPSNITNLVSGYEQ